MKISGFTIGKNISKLYYPVKQSIMSILPIVDEFIVLLGDNDPDDTAREEILSINSDKIKIYNSVWDTLKYSGGTELAHQTDLAKSYCTGDWLFYLQSDEVIHEKYLPLIKESCEKYLNDNRVEGLLFNFCHFWGDYDHYHKSHGWYRKEIRIIRNKPDIHSWRDAQSFRRIPDFDGLDYMQHKDTYKLKVADIGAYVYHYGWVRPPSLMRSKVTSFDKIMRKKGSSQKAEEKRNFDYGVMSKLSVFKGTHPEVMKDWIARFNWKDELQQTGKRNKNRRPYKHEKPKYRLVSFIEKYILFGTPIWEFKNYIKIR